MAGVGLAASARGLMYALVRAGRRGGRWTFARQAWDLLRLAVVAWGPGVPFEHSGLCEMS